MWSAENESGQHNQLKEVGPLQIVILNSLIFMDFLLVIFHFMFSIYSGSVPKTMLFRDLLPVIFKSMVNSKCEIKSLPISIKLQFQSKIVKTIFFKKYGCGSTKNRLCIWTSISNTACVPIIKR